MSSTCIVNYTYDWSYFVWRCRFCSAFGAGGAPVSAVAALAEVVGGDGNRRARTIGPLLSAAAAGALLAAGLAAIALPLTGKDTVLENKEHFSAWHRYNQCFY